MGELLEHTFRFMPSANEHPRHVDLAGDFNGWSTDATPMHPDGRSFTTVLKLANGVHHYKFVVDGHWMPDPAADRSFDQDDGNGGMNSGVSIGFERLATPAARVGIVADAVAFDTSDPQDCNVASPTELRLSFRAQANNLTSAAVCSQDIGGSWTTAPLYKAGTSGGLDRFGGVITTNQSQLGYVLALSNGSTQAYVGDGMLYDSAPAAEAHPYRVAMEPTFRTPQWAKHAVWYQIFPERFRNGDTANDPPNTIRWTSSWYDRQPGKSGEPVKLSRQVFDRRYGGDLQGVEQELPYLRSLGVNAIYLNPIFEADSLHKYDTNDYRHVDQHFGYAGDLAKVQSSETDDPATWQWTRSDRLFLKLVAEAHRQGFRVIVDGVFNHTGTDFWAFQDVIRNGRKSKYAGWFDIIDWKPGVDRRGQPVPFHYRAWDGENGSLPAFKKDPVLGIVHGPREHILAIAKRWLAPDGDPSAGVDGFRLDAAEIVPHPFWAEFRKTVKAIKPEAYIDGEIWTWAQPWLSGDQFDGVMNYQFAMPSQQFFVNKKRAVSAAEYCDDLDALVYRYPLQVALVNQNLLDSHDTDRAASMFVNPDREYNGSDPGSRYNVHKPTELDRERMLQEVAVQMTFLGAPMIYYGDEAGMWGATDPSDRQPMIWKDLGAFDDPEVTFDQRKFDGYQRLIALRQRLPVLQTGFFHTIPVGDSPGLFGFERTGPGVVAYVVVNRSPQERQVSFAADAADLKNLSYVDWLAPATAHVLTDDIGQPNGRPKLILNEGAPTVTYGHGRFSLILPAWGVAVVGPSSTSASSDAE